MEIHVLTKKQIEYSNKTFCKNNWEEIGLYIAKNSSLSSIIDENTACIKTEWEIHKDQLLNIIKNLYKEKNKSKEITKHYNAIELINIFEQMIQESNNPYFTYPEYIFIEIF